MVHVITLHPYCHSAGAGMHGPLLMGACAVILLESRTLGFDVKTQPSVLLLGMASVVISARLVFLSSACCYFQSLHVHISVHVFHTNLNIPVTIPHVIMILLSAGSF